MMVEVDNIFNDLDIQKQNQIEMYRKLKLIGLTDFQTLCYCMGTEINHENPDECFSVTGKDFNGLNTISEFFQTKWYEPMQMYVCPFRAKIEENRGP